MRIGFTVLVLSMQLQIRRGLAGAATGGYGSSLLSSPLLSLEDAA